MAGLWRQCGARATQQLCLMSRKRLRTWTLIPSAVRRPVSNAECQECPGRLSSDGTQWEQTVGLSRKHCILQETGVSLKMLDREESVGSRFCFFYETSTFKETQGITQLLNVSMPALKICDFLLILPDLDVPGSSYVLQLAGQFERKPRPVFACSVAYLLPLAKRGL